MNEEDAPGFDYLAKDKARQVASMALLMADRHRYAAGQLERAAQEITDNRESEDALDFLRYLLTYTLNSVIAHTNVDNTEALIELIHLAVSSASYAEKARKEKK